MIGPEIDPSEEPGPEQILRVVDLGLDPQRARAGIDGRCDEGHDAFERAVGERGDVDLDRLAHADPLRVELGQAEDRVEGMHRDELEERRTNLDVLSEFDRAPRNESREGRRNTGVRQRALSDADRGLLGAHGRFRQQQRRLRLFETLDRRDVLGAKLSHPLDLARLLAQVRARLGEPRLRGGEIELSALGIDLDHDRALGDRAPLVDRELRHATRHLGGDHRLETRAQITARADLLVEIDRDDFDRGHRGQEVLGRRDFLAATRAEGQKTQ